MTTVVLPVAQAGPAPDPQTGPDDFRVSEMGGAPGDPKFSASGRPKGAWNPQAEETLVVWPASDTVEGLREIYGQRVAADGSLLGTRIQISDLSEGNPSFSATAPDIVFNEVRGEYFVVWSGEDFFAANRGREIYGRRVGSNGALLGDTLRLSFMGADTAGDPSDAYNPAIAYNGLDDRYLVVWYADAGAPGLADDEYEIFARRLGGNGAPVGQQTRVSAMGVDGDAAIDAFEPDVGFDPTTGRYLVVWHGDQPQLADDGWEIYGQLLDTALQPLGVDDFSISSTGGSGDATYTASWPAVAFDQVAAEWLVVWHGDSPEGLLVDEEFEIFGQRLNSAGGPLGEDDFRISTMGADGWTSFFAFDPDVAAGADGSFLVGWYGIDRGTKTEIHVRRVTQGGVLSAEEWTITATGPAADPEYGAFFATLVATQREFLALYLANDETGGHVQQEVDVFGQRLGFPIFCDGFESGDADRWSQTLP